MNVENLIEILNEIEYPVLMEVDLESIWRIDDFEIVWNRDGNRNDLEDDEGETYIGYLPEGFHVQGDYLICNVDTQSGCWVTRIFSVYKEVKVLE